MPSAPDKPAGPIHRSAASRISIDRSMPLVVRRRMLGFWAIWAMASLLIVGLLINIGANVLGDVATWSLAGVPVLGFALAAHYRSLASAAIGRAARADHLLCPQCTYDLRTLDEAGACPECGRAYEHEAVRAQWVDARRRLKRRRAGGDGAS